MEVNLHFGYKYSRFARQLRYLHDSEIDEMKTFSVARNGIPDNRRYRTEKVMFLWQMRSHNLSI